MTLRYSDYEPQLIRVGDKVHYGDILGYAIITQIDTDAAEVDLLIIEDADGQRVQTSDRQPADRLTLLERAS